MAVQKTVLIDKNRKQNYNEREIIRKKVGKNMKEIRNKILPVVYITVIAAVALFMSNVLNTNVISSIQGYRFSGRPATSSNATNSNATNSNVNHSTNSNVNHSTNSNATNSNVNHSTNGNATNSNATNTNATRNNAVALNLMTFDLKQSEAKVGDKVNLTIVTTGATVTRGTVGFTKVNGTGGFATTIEYDSKRNASIKVPIAEAGEYRISYVMLGGNTGTGAAFSTTFTPDGSTGTKQFTFNKTLKILSEADANKIINILEFSVENGSVERGAKLNLKLRTNKTLKRASLILADSNANKVRLPIRSMNGSNPYVEVLSTMKDDSYSVEGLILESNESITQYAKIPQETEKEYSFTQSVSVIGESRRTACYNNEDLSPEIIDTMINSKAKTISLNADNSPLISERLFTAIQGKDKALVIEYGEHQWTFKGADITDPKAISATIATDTLDNNDEIDKHLASGAVVHFDDNGYLPGKATVTIREDEIVKENLSGNNANVYLYNPTSDKFIEIAKDVNKEDGGYSFDITHNSSYVLTQDKLPKEIVEKDTGTVVSYVKEKKIYIVLLLIGLIVVLCAVLVVVILKNQKKKASNKLPKEETKEEKDSKEEKELEDKEEKEFEDIEEKESEDKEEEKKSKDKKEKE